MAKLLDGNRAHASVSRIPRGGTDLFTLDVPPARHFTVVFSQFAKRTVIRATGYSPSQQLEVQRKQEIRLEWWHGIADKISYQLEAFTPPIWEWDGGYVHHNSPLNAPPCGRSTDGIPLASLRGR